MILEASKFPKENCTIKKRNRLKAFTEKIS